MISFRLPQAAWASKQSYYREQQTIMFRSRECSETCGRRLESFILAHHFVVIQQYLFDLSGIVALLLRFDMLFYPLTQSSKPTEGTEWWHCHVLTGSTILFSLPTWIGGRWFEDKNVLDGEPSFRRSTAIQAHEVYCIVNPYLFGGPRDAHKSSFQGSRAPGVVRNCTTKTCGKHDTKRMNTGTKMRISDKSPDRFFFFNIRLAKLVSTSKLQRKQI